MKVTPIPTSATQNIWDHLNDAEWQELRRQIDWMSAAGMHQHVTALMGGGHWLDYARDRHLVPLLEQLRRKDPSRTGLRLVAVGCGNATIEKHFFSSNWPISEILCLEYSHDLIKSAEQNLSDIPIKKAFRFFDMNNPTDLGARQFDVVWFCHSIHHCTDIETFLPFMNGLVSDEGVIMGCDYFGPNRLQLEPETREMLTDLFALLPEHLRLNISKRIIEDRFEIATAKEIADYDPSEAPRSRDIKSLLFSLFPIVETRPMGGTLLRHLITHRAGNFQSESDRCILGILQYVERLLIKEKVITSDDLFFVLKKSDRI